MESWIDSLTSRVCCNGKVCLAHRLSSWGNWKGRNVLENQNKSLSVYEKFKAVRVEIMDCETFKKVF